MIRVPMISTDEKLNETFKAECERAGEEFAPVFMNDTAEMIEYFKYELPDIKIFYFSDKKADSVGILNQIQNDPWLHYGGIIAIHDNSDEKNLLETMRNSNIIAVLRKTEFMRNIPRILRILRQNKHILFQRGLQQHLLNDISGSFVMDNDPLDVTIYTNLLTNYLFNSNLISRDTKEKLHVALLELLINAIEHGNCKITFDEKTKWLEKNRDIMELIREKNKDATIKSRKVFLAFSLSRERTKITVRDEGDGFDWRTRLERKMEPGLNGMGMKMASLYVTNLSYNEKGNEVSFMIDHQMNESNTIPAIFKKNEATRFGDGEFVFREGEESDFLYYIVSGKVHVYSKGKLVSTLTPDDMFLGEMSFLLGNKRSASVVSKGKSVLVRISKNDFVNLIKDNPHYGIFLARLLAQRLARLNARTAKLNTEYLRLRDILEMQSPGLETTT